MSEELRLAQSYKIRAKDLRTLAEMDDHTRTKAKLMNVAQEYDRIAETMELIDRTNKTLKRRTQTADPLVRG